MSIQQSIERLNSMSAEEIAFLESIPAEQIKEAQAEVNRELLADSLYQYGWLQAEREFATYEGEGDLSKVASEEAINEHVAQEEAIKENIETLLADLGTGDNEDEVELLKEAQAAAGFIFAGYTDALEKIAKAKPKAAKGFMAKARAGMKSMGKSIGKAYEGAKEMAGKGYKSVKEHSAKAMKTIKKHPGKAGLAAGLGLAAGGLVAKKMYEKHHEKKASDMTVLELHAELTKVAEVEAGLEKLAQFAAAKGEAARATLE